MTIPNTPERSAAETTPPWDPILVRDLVREAQSSGQHPALIELGHLEASSFRAFLAEAFGEEGTLTLKDTYYLGLEVVAVDTPTRLAVCGNKPNDAWGGELPPLWTDRPDRAA